MSLELLGAHQTAEGIAVTFATEHGIEPLEGTPDEVSRLAEIMKRVSVFAALNQEESVWLEEVPVGNAVVKLGVTPGGNARISIIRS